MLRKLAPGAKKIAVLLNPNNPNVDARLDEVRQVQQATNQSGSTCHRCYSLSLTR
jgi:hypothetical protein